MQAIILAAGMGRRLGELTGNNTKCMLKVNGIPLINRMLDSLTSLDISRIVIVTGYKGENVKSYLGAAYNGVPIEYIDNPIYDRTNNIYSLYLAKDRLCAEDSLLLESDIIFEASVLNRLMADPNPNLALVDKYESWMDGTVVTLDKDLRINNFITKKHFKYEDIDKYYKTVNIYKFSQDFSRNHYVPFLEAYCHVLGKNEYYEQVLRVLTLLDDAPLKALPLNGEKWYEIDDVQDLDIAQSMFCASASEQMHSVTGRYGGFWRFPHMLDFCYLVNPYYPKQNMLDELKANFEPLLRSYPSGMRVNSLLAAKNFGIRQEHIVVGNGAAELIKSLMENEEGPLGAISPTFEEYPHRCKNVITYIPKNKDFHYTASDIMDFFGDREVKCLLLINPDNPSGNYIAFDELLELIEWTGKRGIRFIVDESFVDFVDDMAIRNVSLLQETLLIKHPHLCVIKSISKSYGVPGLRLGILASSNEDLIQRVKKDVAIWNVNSFGEFFMQIFEKYQKDYADACDSFRRERVLFEAELKQIKHLRLVPSQANYFLCELLADTSDCRIPESCPVRSSEELAARLLSEFDILIKDCSGKSAFDGLNYIRIAIRDRSDNHRLIEALTKILS